MLLEELGAAVPQPELSFAPWPRARRCPGGTRAALSTLPAAPLLRQSYFPCGSWETSLLRGCCPHRNQQLPSKPGIHLQGGGAAKSAWR